VFDFETFNFFIGLGDLLLALTFLPPLLAALTDLDLDLLLDDAFEAFLEALDERFGF
jgi:hypothetical protein